MSSDFSPEILDQLLLGYSKPDDLTSDNGIFKRLKKALIERALGAELSDHLGYEKGDPAGRGSGNTLRANDDETSESLEFSLEGEGQRSWSCKAKRRRWPVPPALVRREFGGRA